MAAKESAVILIGAIASYPCTLPVLHDETHCLYKDAFMVWIKLADKTETSRRCSSSGSACPNVSHFYSARRIQSTTAAAGVFAYVASAGVAA